MSGLRSGRDAVWGLTMQRLPEWNLFCLNEKLESIISYEEFQNF